MKIIHIFTLLLTINSLVFSQGDLVEAFPNLSFNRPLDLLHPPDNTDRIFVVSQQGYIYSFDNDSTISVKHTFLDISDSVSRVHNEEGLLGMAFHPQYASNRQFYVYYSKKNDQKSILARYHVSNENPDSAILTSQLILMEIEQPARNHNGGQIAFGPDGYLYVALGDGGGSGDRYLNGQDLQTLLGSILRINVDSTSSYGNYAIPADNPFAGNSSNYREEIYAYGLRNPWRFSFDPASGWLWTGDVGQGQWEEVDIIESGQNYGWNIMEGMHCYNNTSCDDSGLSYPVVEYSHSLGNSITGGHVYRGSRVPALYGKYIYVDFGSSRVWALEYDGINDPQNEELMNSGLNIAGFGIDQNYELYACAFDGKIYKFQSDPPVTVKENKTVTPFTFSLDQNFPNPFNPFTIINYQLSAADQVILRVYDINGKELTTLQNGFQAAGNYSISFSGVTFNSGFYFYKLQVGNFSKVRRMLLIK